MSRPVAAVFLDRDGTIIEDRHYMNDPSQVALLPGAAEALRLMAQKGYLLFVVSNQSGVSRGIINDEQFLAVHNRVGELLQQESCPIAEFAYCFHHPDDKCGCRKPQPGLVPQKFEGRDIDWLGSYTVGDKSCDVELAATIGGSGYLVLTGKGADTWKALQQASPVIGFRVMPDLLAVARALPGRGG